VSEEIDTKDWLAALSVINTAFRDGRAKGRAEATAEIVAWLRRGPFPGYVDACRDGFFESDGLALAIERGEHLEKKT